MPAEKTYYGLDFFLSKTRKLTPLELKLAVSGRGRRGTRLVVGGGGRKGEVEERGRAW